jgi:hypothetical protein
MKVDLHKEASVQFQVAAPVFSIGWIIAVLVLLLAILGLIGVVPNSPTVVFGMFAALAVARLL